MLAKFISFESQKGNYRDSLYYLINIGNSISPLLLVLISIENFF